MLTGLLAAVFLPAPPLEPFPIEDTYIDSQLPDNNFGRDGLLLAGSGTAILVRFPALNWMRPDQLVDTATLSFTLVEPADLKLKSVKKLSVAWSEGANLRLPVAHPPQPDPQYRGGATWKTRRYGPTGQKWDSAGATGEDDAKAIDGVSLSTEGSLVTITGLGPVLAELQSRPWQNFGLRIEFEGKGSFFSSEGLGSAPRVSFTTKPVKEAGLAVLSLEPNGSGWAARVQNVSDAVITGVSAAWKIRGETKSNTDTQQALAPGDTATMTWEVNTTAEKASPDVTPLMVQVQPGGTGGPAGSQSSLTASITGLPINIELTDAAKQVITAARGSESEERFLQRIVTFVNEGVLAQSRTSFAPEGCRERVRLVSSGSAMTVRLDVFGKDESVFVSAAQQIVRQISPYVGAWSSAPDSSPIQDGSLGHLADTRDDTAWLSTLMLPVYPWGDPKDLQPPLPERFLISRAEVAALNELAGKPIEARSGFTPIMPDAAILSLADMAGNPLSSATVEVFQTSDGKLATDPIVKANATAGGKVFLPTRDGKNPYGVLKPGGGNAWFLVRVTKDFMTETAWIPAWLLATEAARGNANAPTIELRLMMPSGALKTDEDLAQGKAVTDPGGRFPAELAAAIDNDPTTAVSLKPGQILDIDLGRDRVIGGVELETKGAPMEKFEILLAKTGQKPEQGELWMKEGRGNLRAQLKGKKVGDNTVLLYTATAVRARYVRVKCTGGSEAPVASIRVRALQQG